MCGRDTSRAPRGLRDCTCAVGSCSSGLKENSSAVKEDGLVGLQEDTTPPSQSPPRKRTSRLSKMSPKKAQHKTEFLLSGSYLRAAVRTPKKALPTQIQFCQVRTIRGLKSQEATRKAKGHVCQPEEHRVRGRLSHETAISSRTHKTHNGRHAFKKTKGSCPSARGAPNQRTIKS